MPPKLVCPGPGGQPSYRVEPPWATFPTNVTGSLMLGTLTGLVLGHRLARFPRRPSEPGSADPTTSSTFNHETLRLVEDGEVLQAAANITFSVGGLAAAGPAWLWDGLHERIPSPARPPVTGRSKSSRKRRSPE